MPKDEGMSLTDRIHLLDVLLRLTQTGKIRWERPEGVNARNDLFIAVIDGDFGVRIFSIDKDGVAPFRLEIIQRNLTQALIILDSAKANERVDPAITDLLTQLYQSVHQGQLSIDTNELFRALEAIDRREDK